MAITQMEILANFIKYIHIDGVSRLSMGAARSLNYILNIT